MRGASTIAVLLATGLGQNVSAETLRDALAQAIASSPAIRSQRALNDALGEDQLQARSAFGPQVSISANGFGSSNNTDGVDTAVALTINQPVFASGRIANASRAAKAEAQAGSARLEAAEAGLISDVARVYADVRRDEANLAAADELSRLLQGQADEVNASFAAGVLTRTDVEQMLMRQADARAGRAAAAGQLETSRAEYASLVGSRPSTLAGLPTVKTFPTVDAAVAAAETESPAIAAARFDQQGTRARVAAARSEFGPSVSLRGNVGYQQIWQYSQQQSVRADTLSVVVNQPLFTSGLNRSRVRQAQDRDQAAENRVLDARRKAVRDVEQAWAAALAAHARTVIGDERAQRSRNAYQGVQIEFRAGLRTTLDVLNAAQELNAAQTTAASAERDAFVSDVRLLQAAGVLETASFSEAPAPVRTTTVKPVMPVNPAQAHPGVPPPAPAPAPASSLTSMRATPGQIVTSATPGALARGAGVESLVTAPDAGSKALPGAYAIQVGAHDEAAQANASLQRLSGISAVNDKPQRIQIAKIKGKLYYRALVGGFDQKAEAVEACKAVAVPCFVRLAPAAE